MTPGANIGVNGAIFEPVHGSAPTIAGMNIANPTAIMLSSVLMLSHIGEQECARNMEQAISAVLAEGKYLTSDLGGTTGTKEFADAVISKLR